MVKNDRIGHGQHVFVKGKSYFIYLLEFCEEETSRIDEKEPENRHFGFLEILW